jgi:hypothetical protein
MVNPILLVNDAGHGETPKCGSAVFKPGDVVKVSRARATAHMPAEAVVLVAVPPGFPGEYALADLLGEARPLMITKTTGHIRYILVNEGDPTPYIAPESALRPSGKEPVEIGEVRRES